MAWYSIAEGLISVRVGRPDLPSQGDMYSASAQAGVRDSGLGDPSLAMDIKPADRPCRLIPFLNVALSDGGVDEDRQRRSLAQDDAPRKPIPHLPL